MTRLQQKAISKAEYEHDLINIFNDKDRDPIDLTIRKTFTWDI